MNPSIRPDKNYLSFTAATQDDIPRHSPINLQEAGTDATISTFLKLSDGIHDVVISDAVIPGGLETAVDLDMAENVHVSGDFGSVFAWSENVLRAKGGFKNISFAGRLWSCGCRNGIDIELGNWMDQTYRISRDCDLRFMEAHKNGTRVTFAVGWVVPFTVRYDRSSCEYLIWQSLKLKAYWIAKYLVRSALRIPVGTKGPDWM